MYVVAGPGLGDGLRVVQVAQVGAGGGGDARTCGEHLAAAGVVPAQRTQARLGQDTPMNTRCIPAIPAASPSIVTRLDPPNKLSPL